MLQTYFVVIEHLRRDDRSTVNHFYPSFHMEFTVISVFILSKIVIHAECRIGTLLNLRNHNARTDRMDRSRMNEKAVPLIHLYFI